MDEDRLEQRSGLENSACVVLPTFLRALAKRIIVDGFVTSLLDLPPEADIISDSVYANSTTLDGRRFAEEFLRRRKLADRGITPEPTPSGASPASMFSSTGSHVSDGKGNAGGWSEVAKKGGQNAASTGPDSSVGTGQFRVVSGKKKAGKR